MAAAVAQVRGQTGRDSIAMRSRTTFKKRQKELARQEKQRDKAARREQRRLAKNSPDAGIAPSEDAENENEDEFAEPDGDAFEETASEQHT
jgi:hypothetical protein